MSDTVLKLNDKEMKICKTVLQEQVLSKDQIINQMTGVQASIDNLNNQLTILETKQTALQALLDKAIQLGLKTAQELADAQ